MARDTPGAARREDKDFVRPFDSSNRTGGAQDHVLNTGEAFFVTTPDSF